MHYHFSALTPLPDVLFRYGSGFVASNALRAGSGRAIMSGENDACDPKGLLGLVALGDRVVCSLPGCE
jgi:hypothetical protein